MSAPRPWSQIGRHPVLPEARHDDVARFNALGNLNRFLAERVAPAVGRAFEGRATRGFTARRGHEPRTRREVREALEHDPAYESWSALRRHVMEMRQQTGRLLVLRQAEALAERAAALNEGEATLRLDPGLRLPSYLTAVDAHLMPGGYTGEAFPGDVSAAANYDCGLFATIGGSGGPWSDAAGRALLHWLGQHHPGRRFTRIVDLGCGLGHNTLPLAQAFPDAQVFAVDAAAPMLRYGHARARALGVRNVTFIQADATRTPLPAGEHDLVFTTMVLHETSRAAVGQLFGECHRLLQAGGLTVHLEQPPYRNRPVFEQFMRDWDGRHNNEPFWTGLHELDLRDVLAGARFRRESIFETAMRPPGATEATAEDYGRAPSWYAVGATQDDGADRHGT
jgi:SAM-dependent methyltransferase